MKLSEMTNEQFLWQTLYFLLSHVFWSGHNTKEVRQYMEEVMKRKQEKKEN